MINFTPTSTYDLGVIVHTFMKYNNAVIFTQWHIRDVLINNYWMDLEWGIECAEAMYCLGDINKAIIIFNSNQASFVVSLSEKIFSDPFPY